MKTLYDYQKRIANSICQNESQGLFVDMGLGKTVSTLTAINDLLFDYFEISKILIVAPLRVANTVWKQEIDEWEHLNGITCSIVTGDLNNRKNQLRKNSHIYVINRENIPWLQEYLLKNKMKFDMVVIDESSSFKNPTSKRFRAMKKLLKNIERRVILTGTPSPNGYMDLWSQIYILDNGERLGPNITSYRSAYFDCDFMGYSYKLREGCDEKINKKISDIVFSMKTEDYISLPEFIMQTIKIDMPRDLENKYNEFKRNMILEMENENDINVTSAAVLTNKLLQFSSGAIYNENQEFIEIHNLKIETLRDILDSTNENVLVAYNFAHEKERLIKAFPEAKFLDANPKTIEDWNNGKIKILLAHPASAGHGLNLQKGGSILIWFGFQWSLELYQQFNKRLHRQGQKNTVRCFHLALGEIEYKLLRSLEDKNMTQKKLLDSLTENDI